MEKGLYMAAMNGDVEFLTEVRVLKVETGCWSNYLLSKTPENSNILHIASQNDQFDFIKIGFNILNFSPPMLRQANAKGDTPIHVASKRGNKKIVELLVETNTKLLVGEVPISDEVQSEICEQISDDHEEQRLWRTKNFAGNTPLHEALINGKVDVATYLVEVDPLVARFVNNTGETPLHLAIKHNVDDDKKLAVDIIQMLNIRGASLSYKGSLLAEKSMCIVKLLLQKFKDAVYIKDSDDLTPLLQAALHSYLPAIEIILNEYPEVAETCDPKGKTILHLMEFRDFEEVKKLMKRPEIYNLKDQQDSMGNTPAHIAVMKCEANITEDRKILDERDIGVVRALLESSTNFSIKNKQGLSAATLFQQLEPKLFYKAAPYELDVEIKEMISKSKYEKMEKRFIWEALENANVNSLREGMFILEPMLLHGELRLPDLVHTLLEACKGKPKRICICYHDVKNLVKEVLEKNPVLICQTNSRGDTLLHILACKQDHDDISESLLYVVKYCYEIAREEVYCPPWRVKNMDGNTPLHQAALLPPKDWKVIRFLVDCENSKDAAVDLNHRNETPLHVLCGSKAFLEIDEEISCEITVKDMIDANIWATYVRDVDGFTPLLRAAKTGKVHIVSQICRISPESAQLRDYEGHTFWHILDMSNAPLVNEANVLREMINDCPKIGDLAQAQDKKGTTPLSLAVKSHNYNIAQFLSDRNKKAIYRELDQLHEEFKDDPTMKYSIFAIRNAAYLPHSRLEEFFWKKMKDLGVKSIFNVPRPEIKDHCNTISVIAVLLATIAFTAAFTVPGGYNSSDGTPILLKEDSKFLIRAAYWVFMIFDVVTLCLSMLVLFCCIWIITGDDADKIVLTDISIVLLHGSFITTMVTMMMGVFASTYRVSSDLAMFTLFACSVVLLLIFHRWVVKVPLQYVFATGYLINELLCEWLKSFFNKLHILIQSVSISCETQ